MSDFFEALKGEPGYTYGDILPYRYRSATPGAPREKGTPIEFSLPTAAREAIGALAHAINTPREALLGHLAGPDLDRAGAMMGPELMLGGAMVPAPGGATAMRVFGGPLARTADKAALGKAFTLESRLKSAGYGKDAVRDAVHKETGWFRGADDKWRFEIPDSEATLKNSPVFQNPDRPTLGEAVHHPQLFAAYPDIANIELKRGTDKDSLGYYNHALQEIGVSGRQNLESVLSTLIHEKQHAIQAREGHAYGGSTQQFLRPEWSDEYDSALRHYESMNDKLRAKGFDPAKVNLGLNAYVNGTEHLLPKGMAEEHARLFNTDPNLYDDWSLARGDMHQLHKEKEAAWNMYNGLAGEVEARLAQARHKEGNYAAPPWTSGGWIPPEDQIVQFATEPGRAK